MAVLSIGLTLVYILGLCNANDIFVPPSPCSLENARYLPIYDLNPITLNVFGYNDVFKSVAENGSYQFQNVESKAFGDMFYKTYPVLVVYQPDENVPELHGYHYSSPRGLRHIYDTERYDSEVHAKYQSFHEYLNNPLDKEGYTPSAALHLYPKLQNYKLTKIVDEPNQQKFTTGFAVLFLFPQKNEPKPKDFEEEYNLFETYYYNSSIICQTPDLDNDDGDDNLTYRRYQMSTSDYENNYSDEFVPLLSVYGHKNSSIKDKGYNLLDLDQINEYCSEKGYYQFGKFIEKFSPYDEYPVLIVFQPDEKVPELNGFYFDEGILDVLSYVKDNPEFLEQYRPFFEYFQKEPDLDGITPDAARYDYPYFFDYKLTKIIHGEDVTKQVAVLFLVPSRHRPANFEENYEIIEDYGISEKYIVEYLVGDDNNRK